MYHIQIKIYIDNKYKSKLKKTSDECVINLIPSFGCQNAWFQKLTQAKNLNSISLINIKRLLWVSD